MNNDRIPAGYQERNAQVRAWEMVVKAGTVGTLLDVGCGNGDFLKLIGEQAPNVKGLMGCDLSWDRVKDAQEKAPNASIFKSGEGSIPLRDESAEVITLLSVLEHVHDERELLEDIWRVLRPGGVFIFAVPYQGLFAWADPSNLKFHFPRLHRAFHMHKDLEYYKKRFIDSQKDGLFGDVSIHSMFHKHYTIDQLRFLLSQRFEIIEIQRFSMFSPILINLMNVYQLLFKRTCNVLHWLYKADLRRDYEALSYYVVASAKKIG